MRRRAPCAACGHIHSSSDARAVGRFSASVTYVAANAGTPSRSTRTEAEADECRWRQSRRAAPVPTVPTPARPAVEKSRPVESKSEPEPFPAALMERVAREKAWLDFLAHVNFSLMVWQLDPEVRKGENVVQWLRRCRDDLDSAIARHDSALGMEEPNAA